LLKRKLEFSRNVPEEVISMTASSAQYTCPAARLANSLLDVWLRGDRYRLRLELEYLSGIPDPRGSTGESERLELLKYLARRMREDPSLFAPKSENPRIGAWLALVGHLCATQNSRN
jgi:hypothetical protein